MHLGYLTTVYPKISHTFIQREIIALEQMGHEITRFSIRRPEILVDPRDDDEAGKTIYILQQGALRLLCSTLLVFLRHPLLWFSGLFATLRMSRASDRGSVRHLAYLVEACQVVRLAHHHHVEHLHVHFGTHVTAVARLAYRMGGPTYSFTVHGPNELDAAIGLSLGPKMEDAAFVVAITSFCAAQLRRWVNYEHWSKIHIVHCGLDDSSFQPTQSIRADSNRLVCVGRLSAQKGQLLLIDAMKKLVDRGVDAELVLAGDGEMRAIIEQRIEQLGLTRQVSITGWITSDQVRQHLAEARALVLPSIAEGLPVVIMEAFAMDRPVISTYIAGIPELVRNNENGWLVPAGDVDGLVEAMTQVMELQVSDLNVMGRQGKQDVLRHHCIRREAKKLADLLVRYASAGA